MRLIGARVYISSSYIIGLIDAVVFTCSRTYRYRYQNIINNSVKIINNLDSPEAQYRDLQFREEYNTVCTYPPSS